MFFFSLLARTAARLSTGRSKAVGDEIRCPDAGASGEQARKSRTCEYKPIGLCHFLHRPPEMRLTAPESDSFYPKLVELDTILLHDRTSATGYVGPG